jgi:hypothetical protein
MNSFADCQYCMVYSGCYLNFKDLHQYWLIIPWKFYIIFFNVQLARKFTRNSCSHASLQSHFILCIVVIDQYVVCPKFFIDVQNYAQYNIRNSENFFLKGFPVSCNLNFTVEKGSLYYRKRTLVVYKTRLPFFQSERLTAKFLLVLCVMLRTL